MSEDYKLMPNEIIGELEPEVDELTLKEKEQYINNLALEMFQAYPIDIQVRPPWMIVRILPRTIRIGLIWAPDYLSQNKPVHEGIVLRTYEPWVRHWTEKGIEKEFTNVCPYQPGDHVLYQHSTGFPIFGLLSEEEYRLVPASNIGDHSSVFGKLEYQRAPIQQELLELLDHSDGLEPEEFVNKLMSEYDVIKKGRYSRTISGR